MKNNFTHLSLLLSLTIASSLVANVARAEFHHSDALAVDKLSQTIANLIDLDLDRQNLVTAAIHRAIASKETSQVPQPVTAGAPIARPLQSLPTVRGRVAKPKPTPTPQIDGMIVKPKPKPSPKIDNPPTTIGQERRLPTENPPTTIGQERRQ
jgi:outer membrane biosynthesis protein TonB